MAASKIHRLKTPLLVAAIAALAVLLAVEWSRQRVVVVPYSPQQPTVSDLSADASELAQRIAVYREQVDAAQRMVTLLIGLSSLYAVILGVSSYLNLQQVLDQSKDRAKQIDALGQHVADIEQSLKESAPALVAAQQSLDAMVARLNVLLAPTDVERDAFYGAHLQEEQRQEILVAERLTAIFGRGSGPDATLADMYRGLGRFYYARSEASRQPDDLERAYYYLLLSIERNSVNFSTHNDLGSVLKRLARRSPSRRAEFQVLARREFERSLEIEPGQQRARFNLADLAADAHKFQEAIDYLTGALEQPNWQTKPFAGRRADIHYNRGVFRALLGKETGRRELAEEALRDVRTACEPLRLQLAKTLMDDTTPGAAYELEWLAGIKTTEIAALRKQAEELIAKSQ